MESGVRATTHHQGEIDRVYSQREAYLGIHLEGEHDLRRPVPSGGYILGHHADVLATLQARALHAPCQAEITYFQIAVRIDEQVRRLQVAVDDVGRMDCKKGSESLVDKVLRGAERIRRSTFGNSGGMMRDTRDDRRADRDCDVDGDADEDEDVDAEWRMMNVDA